MRDAAGVPTERRVQFGTFRELRSGLHGRRHTGMTMREATATAAARNRAPELYETRIGTSAFTLGGTDELTSAPATTRSSRIGAMTTAAHDQASAACKPHPGKCVGGNGASTSWREPASTAIFDRRADTSRESSPATCRPTLANAGPARWRKGLDLKRAFWDVSVVGWAERAANECCDLLIRRVGSSPPGGCGGPPDHPRSLSSIPSLDAPPVCPRSSARP
jgi:hypothetical protein